MIDQQIPDWEDDQIFYLLMGLAQGCSRLENFVPLEEGIDPGTDRALDFLVGLLMLSRQFHPLLALPDPPPPAQGIPTWPEGILR